MRALRQMLIFFVGIVASAGMVNGFGSGNEATSGKPGREILASPVVTLHTRPDWLLLGGIDIPDSQGSIIFKIDGKRLQLPNWLFWLESNNPDLNPLFVSAFRDNRIVYWKGKGSITNTKTREKIVLPLPLSEDPRSNEERADYFSKNIESGR